MFGDWRGSTGGVQLGLSQTGLSPVAVMLQMVSRGSSALREAGRYSRSPAGERRHGAVKILHCWKHRPLEPSGLEPEGAAF